MNVHSSFIHHSPKLITQMSNNMWMDKQIVFSYNGIPLSDQKQKNIFLIHATEMNLADLVKESYTQASTYSVIRFIWSFRIGQTKLLW